MLEAKLGIAAELAGLLDQLGQPELRYAVNVARWPNWMKRVFIQFGPDDALVRYLRVIGKTRASRMRTLMQRAVRLVLSDYDANALLRMYPMHLMSTAQAAALLERSPGGRLLDIGAGSGDVTSALGPLFDVVEAIETSRLSRRRLRASGLVCHAYDVTAQGILGTNFDVIALLNVLDRTDRPLELLGKCHCHMTRQTQLLLSVPLPYRPHVYTGARSREPRERLAVVGNTFSDALLRFVQQVLVPMGFRIDRITRLPYLSGGDSEQPITVLDAAVLVCRNASAQ